MIKVECFMFDVGFFLLVALQKLEIKVALPKRSTPMIKSRGQKKQLIQIDYKEQVRDFSK